MQSSVAASAKGVFQLNGHLRVCEVGVGRGVDQRRTGEATEDFSHSLANSEGVDSCSGHMKLVGQGMSALRRFRLQFRRRHAGAGGLDVDGQLYQLFDCLRIVLEAHDFSQGKSETEGQFRLGEPTVAVMPKQPGYQRMALVSVL